MPLEPVALHAVATMGFFGKLPSRGDFLRAGLPRAFTDPWDDWLQRCLPDSRARLGEDWVLCWLEAPVWRFALAPGVCGTERVVGLWVPSVDRAGRDFPLTVAVIASDGVAASRWLDGAEAAACEAVTGGQEPDMLTAALAAALAEPGSGAARIPDPGTGSVWWTDGAPRVPPTQLATPGLPSPATFASMLNTIEETA